MFLPAQSAHSAHWCWDVVASVIISVAEWYRGNPDSNNNVMEFMTHGSSLDTTERLCPKNQPSRASRPGHLWCPCQEREQAYELAKMRCMPSCDTGTHVRGLEDYPHPWAYLGPQKNRNPDAPYHPTRNMLSRFSRYGDSWKEGHPCKMKNNPRVIRMSNDQYWVSFHTLG